MVAVGFAGWKVYDNHKTDIKPANVSSGPVKYVQGVRPTGPEITVTGTSSCLPHKDTTGGQTLECASAIKTDDGKYYGLIDPTEDYSFTTKIDGRSKVTGILTTVAETGTKYSSEGSIYITAVQKL